MTAVFLSRVHFPIYALGPGKRIGIWFQGCSIRCPGCVSPDTWAFRRGRATVADLIDQIEHWLVQADGVTISGGEPFDQPDALKILLSAVKRRPELDTFVYTGYSFAAVRSDVERMGNLVDALMSEPFDFAAPQTLPLRGSDNQQLHCLTSLGQARFNAFQLPSKELKPPLDVLLDGDGTVWMAGIPKPGDMERLNELLNTDGNQAVTIAHHSPGRNSK